LFSKGNGPNFVVVLVYMNDIIVGPDNHVISRTKILH